MDAFKPITGINQQLNPIQSMTQSVPGTGFDAEGIDGGDAKYNFSNIMAKQLGAVNDSLNAAGEAKDKMITGELKNPHDVQITGMKSQIMLKLTTAVCSKVTSACTTLFQMQI